MINKENHQVIIPISEYELLVKDVSEYINEQSILNDKIQSLKNELQILNQTIDSRVDKIDSNLRQKYINESDKNVKYFLSQLEKNKAEFETKLRRLNRLAWVNKFINLILKTIRDCKV